MDHIYLDHAAATPLRPEVRAAMSPYMEGPVGNPSSVHGWGRSARAALEGARERAAELVGGSSSDVHFVRGGTESVNLAILGRMELARERGHAAGVYFRSAIEHSAVRESMAAAARQGWTVRVLPVRRDGTLDLPDAAAAAALNPPTPAAGEGVGGARPAGHPDPASGAGLVSVQWVNHETGLVLAMEEVARWTSRVGLPLHIDAVQALGHPEVRLDGLPEAMISISGHKLGGPRSTGVLILPEAVELGPRLFGGGQEHGIRPGTEDIAGVVGLVRALELVMEGREEEAERLTRLRDRLEEGLRQALPELRIHGNEGPRAPHILNVGVEGAPRDVLPGALDLEGVGVSAGSACRSGSTSVSPVLQALYGAEAGSISPLRLSLGWTTTREEVDEAVRRIPPAVERVLRLGVGA